MELDHMLKSTGSRIGGTAAGAGTAPGTLGKTQHWWATGPSQRTWFCQQARLHHQLWVMQAQEDVEPRPIEQDMVLVSSTSDCLGSAVALGGSRTNIRDQTTRAQN